MSGRRGTSPEGVGIDLGLLLAALREAKRDLLARSSALREVDARLRTWDLTQPFAARRGRTLRLDAEQRFAEAMNRFHALLAPLSRMPEAVADVHRGRDRQLLAEVRSHLIYLQRAFDGGNPLLPAVARALE